MMVSEANYALPGCRVKQQQYIDDVNMAKGLVSGTADSSGICTSA